MEFFPDFVYYKHVYDIHPLSPGFELLPIQGFGFPREISVICSNWLWDPSVRMLPGMLRSAYPSSPEARLEKRAPGSRSTVADRQEWKKGRRKIPATAAANTLPWLRRHARQLPEKC